MGLRLDQSWFDHSLHFCSLFILVHLISKKNCGLKVLWLSWCPHTFIAKDLPQLERGSWGRGEWERWKKWFKVNDGCKLTGQQSAEMAPQIALSCRANPILSFCISYFLRNCISIQSFMQFLLLLLLLPYKSASYTLSSLNVKTDTVKAACWIVLLA